MKYQYVTIIINVTIANVKGCMGGWHYVFQHIFILYDMYKFLYSVFIFFGL